MPLIGIIVNGVTLPQASDRFRLSFCNRDEAEDAKGQLHPRAMPWIADAREALMRSCRGVSRCSVCHPTAVIIIASSSEPMPQVMSTLFDSSKMPQVLLFIALLMMKRRSFAYTLARLCGTAYKTL